MQPRIAPRSEHGISRRQVSQNALRTLYRLHDNGFVAYLVGGCVRDLLSGRTPKDFDIATDAAPGQIKRLFRNCRLVGRRFRLAHLHFQDEILEVSTFRASAPPSDGEAEAGDQRPPRHLKNEDGMVLRDNVFGTPEEDALRRDFTINALAYNIADGSVIDYCNGLSDLEQRLLRPIGDPHVRFTEDPVRMVRAVRFAASHDLRIETAAWKTLCALSATIVRASPARLYEEIQKLFLLGAARPVFDLLEESGLLAALFPGLVRRLAGNAPLMATLQGNLEGLDRLLKGGVPVSAPLFLAALCGPGIEEEALARHRDGVPVRQALDATGAAFLEELSRTVCIPARVGAGMRGILSVQPALLRNPQRRAAAMTQRPGFADAMTYLCLTAKTREESRPAVQWWQTFIADPDAAGLAETAVSKAAPARQKRRRGRRRPRSVPASREHDS
jgi:poly(A) polymerase